MQSATLNPQLRGGRSAELEKTLLEGVIAQDHVTGALLPAFRRYFVGLNDHRRPVGTFLFLGPTGVGKTLMAESLTRYFHGDPRHLVRIDCAEFRDSHEVAKLLGAPPGYHGHNEVKPRLHASVIDKHSDPAGKKPAIVLFDEVEKAHASFWEITLGISSNATLTTADGRETDFSNTVLIFTSNLGAKEMQATSKTSGFRSDETREATHDHRAREKAALDAAKKHFSPEFMSRLDGALVFNALDSDALKHVLELELKKAVNRLLGSSQARVAFQCTEAVKTWLLKHGSDPQRGARDLAQAIDRWLVGDVAGLVETEQVRPGDRLEVEIGEDGILRYRIVDPTAELAELLQ